MIPIKAIVFAALSIIAPPGNTKYSMIPVECHADECDNYQRSTFYDAWVRPETATDAVARYHGIADALVDAASLELCRDDQGQKIPDCPMLHEARGWNVTRAVAFAAGAAIPESGLREDVEQGRGRAKHPDDVGGEGRGPGGEVCLMQVHPLIAWQFVPGLTDAERASYAATAASREMIARTLLGADQEALVRCFRTGIRMLMRSKAHCDWDDSRRLAAAKIKGLPEYARQDPYWPMYSLYGTGNSCNSFNGTKTTIRRSVAERMLNEMARQRRLLQQGETSMRVSRAD